jgi:hypothetical protein
MYRPSYFTESDSSTPSTCTVVPEYEPCALAEGVTVPVNTVVGVLAAMRRNPFRNGCRSSSSLRAYVSEASRDSAIFRAE